MASRAVVILFTTEIRRPGSNHDRVEPCLYPQARDLVSGMTCMQGGRVREAWPLIEQVAQAHV